MTPAQCRAARALLGWDQVVLAHKAGMRSQMPCFYFEKHGHKLRDEGTYSGSRYVSLDTVKNLEKTLMKAGIEFIEDTGVNLRKDLP
jgi:hypothetical protein